MPYRSLPDSDATRISALDALLKKAGLVPPAERPYSDALQTQLTTLQPQFKREATEAGSALSAQGAATSQATLDFLALQTVVSHFIQVFNMAITRGIFPKEARAHYQLDLTGSALPELATQADVVLWAGHLIAGETARLDAGATVPMAMPSAAEATAALGAYNATSATQTTAKDTYDAEQEQKGQGVSPRY